MSKSGKVYLIGAGPGDERLITLRGLDCIQAADVIVYDRLVNERLLEHRKSGCKCVYVGKSPAGHTKPQEEINRLLVRFARQGKTVARLKGGDPFVFGRGGEEALELAEHSIPFEVIPGVTSAFAGPAAAGIPVTHRGIAAGVTVVAGHEDPSKAEAQVEWERLGAGAETLVILMGVKNLARIAARLMAGGRKSETPVAVIRHATTTQQEVLTSTLGDVAEDIVRRGIRAPAVIVVGDVVCLRDWLSVGERKPLAGKRILITRPAEQAEEFAELLRAQGARPILFPVIRIVPNEDIGPLHEAIRQWKSFDWLIFTSANGVRTAVPHLKSVLPETGWPCIKVAAVGPGTAQVCRELGLDVSFIPRQYAVEAIVKEFPENVAGQRMLLLRAQEANPALSKGLRANGARVEEIPAYRVEPVADNAGRLIGMLRAGEVDVITLTSSSTVQGLIGLLGEDSPQLLHDICVACLGHVTAQTFQEMTGRAPEVQARVYTMEGLTQAIIEWQKEGNP